MNAGGVGLHWREAGEGRPMVLLHGLADSHRSLLPLAQSLSGRRRLLVDLPGHGLSDRPDASYSPEWHASVISDWWQRLGLEDVDLVAHSYGGAVAQLLLLERRAEVRSLTLIAPGGLGREVAWGLRLMALPGAAQVVAPFLGLGLYTVLRQQGLSRDEAALSAWTGSRPHTARSLARTVGAAIDLSGQTRGMHERLADIGLMPPMALLWGDRDPILPVAQAHRTKRLLPALELKIYPGVRHWPHLERPREVARDLTELLGRHDRPWVEVDFAHAPPRRCSPWTRLKRFFRAATRKLGRLLRRLRPTPRPTLRLPADASPSGPVA